MQNDISKILDKLPFACISIAKNKKVLYFNYEAKKKFIFLKENIKIDNIIESEEQITFSDISLNITTHKVFREDKEIKLGPTEFNLLRFFLENIDRVFSRDQLLNHVWKNDALVEPRTVDVHVRRLRKVLNTNNEKDYIRTVRSAGYSFGHN